MAHLDSVTTVLKLLADQTRLRILSVLQGNELTVKELTDILSVGQSTISTQLGQLRDAELVSGRKQGQFVYYRPAAWPEQNHLGALVRHVMDQVPDAPWYQRDQRQLADVIERRREASLAYFNTSRTQNQVSPGQTWESVALGMIHLIHGQRVVDLGCGIGRLSAQFAHAGNTVVGIDNSAEQIAAAQNLHRHSEYPKLSFHCAPAERTGLADASQDLALISQALHHAAQPRDVIREAARILDHGGRLLVLDLLVHTQDWIQEKFADFWLGFAPEDLSTWCRDAGLVDIRHQISSPDPAYPEIEPLVLTARKPPRA